MSPNKSAVLITGATGFVGAHAVAQALEAGYRVRITARSHKVEALKEKYAGKVEVVGIDNIAEGDYTDALQGVDAVMHIAAPLPGKADAAGMINGAVGGALNIIRQAAAKGVKRIVFTSSMLVLLDFDKQEELFDTSRVLSDKDWSQVTKEDVLSGEHDPAWIYAAAKTIAEREVWKFADEHPEIDITAILPPIIYGPLVDTNIPRGDIGALSTNGLIYANVLPQGGSSVHVDAQGGSTAFMQLSIDVRDVAKAHVLALSSPLEKDVGRKRLVIAGEPVSWLRAVEYLRSTRPELASRLPDTTNEVQKALVKIDTSRAASVLGLTEYINWKKTVDDTVDTLLAVEKEWSKAA